MDSVISSAMYLNSHCWWASALETNVQTVAQNEGFEMNFYPKLKGNRGSGLLQDMAGE